MKKRVAINGLGRIGNQVLRHYINNLPQNCEIVAANTSSVEDAAYLLQYDSVHGRAGFDIQTRENKLIIDRHEITIVSSHNPLELPWKELGIDIVIDCTGRFTDGTLAVQHIQAGAKKVLISAPGKNVDLTIVKGVNHQAYDSAKHHIISNASCTTNSLAPVMKVLEEEFGVENAMITTTHAYTSSQVTVDKRAKKRRRGRAAAVNIIPTTTGAAVATIEVIPALEGKMEAMALRVPVPDGAITEVVALLNKDVNADEVNAAFIKASQGELQGILEFTKDEIVSSDILGNRHSSIVDGLSTSVIGGRMVKVMAWYDNEYGYSQRLLEVADYMASKL
ncbi:type I glyceraldehyde-3-phosphate dehydrogenase [Sulfurimonas autotrophica]|uniref:Glyceraldehyde-3-phosphate dehydrogenase n=1 Tax=Sulfurimonas autotrophica (strain ATCC BAA-671 / DSM 16294 / JCM 11897 / OK10) TaxID=563040 RepID=E0UP54_SULAO|nr:type I glyceraldehyde-3-phosphate dehydrogenase [Sulfurimonas autotrophica]ADN08518.1 glyceraldehyde-3-phosphate dehydrogenase, type I [Sulfurimonas autotrophica DSM 16294]